MNDQLENSINHEKLSGKVDEILFKINVETINGWPRIPLGMAYGTVAMYYIVYRSNILRKEHLIK